MLNMPVAAFREASPRVGEGANPVLLLLLNKTSTKWASLKGDLRKDSSAYDLFKSCPKLTTHDYVEVVITTEL